MLDWAGAGSLFMSEAIAVHSADLSDKCSLER